MRREHELNRVCRCCDKLLPMDSFETIVNSKTLHPFTEERHIRHKWMCFECAAEYAIHGTYVCVGCGIEKPVSEFYKTKQASRGHYSRCKKCRAILVSEWYALQENKLAQIAAVQANYEKKNCKNKNTDGSTIVEKKD